MTRVLAAVCLAAMGATQAAAQQTARCFDKVAVSGFTMSPDQLSADRTAAFQAVITNNCTTPFDVPWEVREVSGEGSGAPIAMGKTLVPAMSSVTVTAASGDGVMMFDGTARLKQIADDGTCSFWFVADPYDQAVRDGMKANNSSAKIVRYVAPALRTVVLSPDVARMYGATLRGRTLAGSQCTAPKIVIMDAAAPYSFRVQLDCSGGNMGGKASFEGFMTFILRNGYTVKRIRRYVNTAAPDVCNNSQADEAANRAGITFDAPPAVGSSNPYFKAQLWAQGRRGVVACLALDVEGPFDYNDAGTRTPYHCDKPQSGWSCDTGLRR